MGYSLWFGEFAACVDHEERHVSATAQKPEGVEWPNDAPLSSSVDCGNACHPSYSAWSDFCRRAGLELSDLIQEHPGVVALTAHDLDRLERALDSYVRECGISGAQAEVMALESQARRKENGWRGGGDAPAAAWDVLRLRWLVYWTRWCLENCKYPTFANS